LAVKGRVDEEGEQMLAALAADYTRAELSAADRALLDYAIKLTVRPGEMNAADAGALRAQGFGDRAIHDICAITAYYAFVNRIADGLGVDLESSEGDER
jgi:uncharacterized peroxidase-related enzyme